MSISKILKSRGFDFGVNGSLFRVWQGGMAPDTIQLYRRVTWPSVQYFLAMSRSRPLKSGSKPFSSTTTHTKINATDSSLASFQWEYWGRSKARSGVELARLDCEGLDTVAWVRVGGRVPLRNRRLPPRDAPFRNRRRPPCGSRFGGPPTGPAPLSTAPSARVLCLSWCTTSEDGIDMWLSFGASSIEITDQSIRLDLSDTLVLGIERCRVFLKQCDDEIIGVLVEVFDEVANPRSVDRFDRVEQHERDCFVDVMDEIPC